MSNVTMTYDDAVAYLQQAVRYLASMCDYAQTDDGSGFNGRDAGFGHSLARTPRWSLKQAKAAARLLRTYSKTQLAGHDDLHRAMATVQATDRRPPIPRTISMATHPDDPPGTLALRFGYDVVTKEALKANTATCGFNREAGYWRVRPTVEGCAWLLENLVDGVRDDDFGLWTWDDDAKRIIERKAKESMSRVIDFEADRFVYRFDFDRTVNEHLKQRCRAKFTHLSPGSAKVWNSAVSDDSVRAIEDYLMPRLGFVLTQPALDAIQRRDERAAASYADDADLPEEWHMERLGGTLRPFQRAGVRYAINAERCIIGDQMGLGKTIQALASIYVSGVRRALVVCPATLKLNWERETATWMPWLETVVVTGRNGTSIDDLPDSGIVIINYDILTYHEAMLKQWAPGAVVADESHRIKNHRAKRSESLSRIARNARYRWFLTGTAVLNRPQELIHQLSVLDRLDEFGGFWPFAQRYCDAHHTRFGTDMSGAINLAELNVRLREACYVRREKSQVLKELPAKQRVPVPIEMTNRSEYEKARKAFRQWLLAKKGKEAADSATRAEQLAKVSHLRTLAAEGKAKAALDWLTTFLESGEKLVVFAHHRAVVASAVEGLRKAGYGVVTITGDTSSKDRQAAVDGFQNDDTIRVIVANMQAASEGLTLTAASNVAFLELPWTPGLLQQAEDRCHRIGQEDSVTSYMLLADGTVDMTMAEMLDRKEEVVITTLTGDEVDREGENAKVGIVNGLVEALTGTTLREQAGEETQEAPADVADDARATIDIGLY